MQAKKQITFVWLLLCFNFATPVSVYAQFNYAKNFTPALMAGAGFGYTFSDASGFNRWARTQNYTNVDGSYIPFTFDVSFIGEKGHLTALEFTGHLTTTSNPTPNTSYFMIRHGYNIRSLGNFHIVSSLGLGINTHRIRFANTVPPAFAGFGFTSNAFCRRTSAVISPEINIFYRKPDSESNTVVGIKMGAAATFLQGKWRYGEYITDAFGNNIFDREIVEGVPETMREMFYIKFYLAHVIATH